MGFGFHASGSLKENRALIKKRKGYKAIRDSYEGCLNDTELKFKDLSDFEKKKIRDKIIVQAKRDRSKEILIYVVSFLIISPLIFLFIWVFYTYLL
ncbi:MAG: hypothetical protein ED555_04855 [Allomuricauda sp.]|nr:MAG: hypothetical protein ED555_04855 [Allomuricauda sp.]